jgi:hypothetical protein
VVALLTGWLMMAASTTTRAGKAGGMQGVVQGLYGLEMDAGEVVVASFGA